ncbi:MAG: hypothetical protein GY931_09355 [Maribacter sp.]|nr:hypothetical protein [Maribacter sp.]
MDSFSVALQNYNLCKALGGLIMLFLRTKQATDWPSDNQSKGEKIIRGLLFFIPTANPGYDGKMHLVKEWLVEFNSDGLPNREIGMNSNGDPVIAGPDNDNYGFWLDTNMELSDFIGEEVLQEEFEQLWKKADVSI